MMTIDFPIRTFLRRRLIHAAIWTAVVLVSPVLADTLKNGGKFIESNDLPSDLAAALKKLGGRLTSAETARVVLSGTITDASGSRSAQITVQAPGHLRFEDGSRTLTYNGERFQSNSGQITGADEPILETLLAHLPDTVFLQLATGGGLRRVGSRFRTDNGITPIYSGPYWTMYMFSPANRPGLTRGKALQQEIFIALDEHTWLISEIRVVDDFKTAQQKVTQTQFSNWFQQAGQWFPGMIVRLESGRQTLSFQVLQASLAAEASAATFEP